MAYQDVQPSSARVWTLAARQHGVIARAQLLALGYSAQAIKRRVASGRLHPVWRGVYAVGRPQLSEHGVWMAAVLTCGRGAVLSHGSAAALLEILPRETGAIHVARQAGLPSPLAQQYLNGFRVDFYWPELRLVVETDGLRYHRTPAQQAKDRLRDQTHAAAGLTPLRFTYAQVTYDPDHVRRTLAAVAARLRAAA